MTEAVLWVDDDIPAIRSVITELQKNGQVRIDNAADISTAVKKLIAVTYDLIIIDVIMPAGPIEDEFPFLNPHFESYQHNGGFGLLSILLSHDWHRLCGDRPRPPIVVSSAYPRLDEEEIIKAPGRGARASTIRPRFASRSNRPPDLPLCAT
jgi:CheY-like chemotaxis protein